MKKTFSSKKSAFSLIELSIVLIIIGLLIAGVTGGASLIKSSELRSAISEARGYAVAINGFYAQYNALPGDYEVAIAGAMASSSATGSNGKIEYYADGAGAGGCASAAGSSVTADCDSESIVAWDQLIKTGTIDSTTTLTPLAIGVAQAVGTNMPASKIKFAGWNFDYRNNVGVAGNYSGAGTNEGLAATPANQNVVVLTPATVAATAATNTLVNGTANVAETTANTGAITGPDALSIDTKIDDSFANAGKVRGLNPGDSASLCYTETADANVNYIVSHATNKVCNLTFQVDVNS